MSTWLLPERQDHLRERMDDPKCDPAKLEATYRHFAFINPFIAGWRRIYARWLRPELQGGAKSLLDIGCGGGDVLLRLAHWANEDGFTLELTGIDPEARAVRHALTRPLPRGVRFVRAHSRDLARAGERFDLVISNHILHHLTDAEVTALCHDSERLAARLALHNDLNRNDLSYLVFNLGWPFFLDSFITSDGLTSIRRSFTRAELREVMPEGWRIEGMFPYRNLLVYRPSETALR